MKVWIKYVIGAVIGVVFALILPASNQNIQQAISFITEIVVRFGRYMVIPLVFFTTITAMNKLRDNKMLFKTGVWIGITIVVSSLLLTVVGLLSILIIRLPRIPITVENVPPLPSLGIFDLIRSIFPYSAFESLGNGTFLLAAFFFACLIGTASTADSTLFKPVTALSDSLSKLLYNISVIFTEFLAIGMVAILTSWTIQFKDIIASGVFTPLIIILFVDFVIVAGGIYPLIIRYLCHDPHPYRILYSSICSVITAFFSGDSNLVLQLTIRHCKESLGIRRRINGVTHPLFTVFARGGSALVTALSFVVIWRSYSGLGIPFFDILWIMGVSFAISFVLGGFPTGGAFISLTVLCSLYGKGFENGFLLLRPAAPILCSFAAAFEALTAFFGSYIIAVKTKCVEHHGIKNFI